MAKTAWIERAKRAPKFPTRKVRRCQRCGKYGAGPSLYVVCDPDGFQIELKHQLPIAEALPEHAARECERHAGQREEPDQDAELGAADAQPLR